jgi:hypothetical protein
MVTRDKALQALQALKPARAFLELYEHQGLAATIWPHVGVPDEFFLAPETQEDYCEGGLIPILDDGAFGTVVFYDPGSGGLVLKLVEDPNEVVARFERWEQYLAYVFFQMAEVVDDDSQLARLGAVMGFSRVPAAMEALDAGEARCREFIASLA